MHVRSHASQGYNRGVVRLVAIALALLAGCSFVFMHGSDPDVRCQLEAPVTDTVLAALAVGVTTVAAVTQWRCTNSVDGCGPRLWQLSLPFTVPIAVINGASAIYGFSKRSGCRTQRAVNEPR